MANSARAKPVVVRVKRLAHAEGLPLPAYQTDGAAGLDLVAAVADDAPLMLEPGDIALVPTGLVLEIPPGFEAQVRPRSGLALKHGITLPNTPGTIDSDYRGELGVILANIGRGRFVVRRGERIAQLVLAPVSRARLSVVADVSDTRRGAGGFGSTGVGGPAAAAGSKKKPVAGKRSPAKTPPDERGRPGRRLSPRKRHSK